MISAVHGGERERGRARYTLVGTEHGRAWGVCAEVEGLFGDPRRGTYELFDWVPQTEVRGWVGGRVWLVPGDKALGPWLLEDAASPGERPGTDSLVLTGLDDYEGPPEGHRGPVRVHDGRRWLGSCGEVARVLPAKRPAPPLVLRGLAPDGQLLAALRKGTRQALDLQQAALEIRDDQGETLTDLLLWAAVSAWRPSSRGTALIDLELDGELFTPIPEYARPLWERWFAGPPQAPGAWAGFDTRHRGAWLDVVRERGCRRTHHARSAGHAYALNGRHITDVPGLYLALGEAVNGPGGYFGGCLDALVDCLRGTFGHIAPATLLWRDAVTARAHLRQVLTPDGRYHDLFTETLNVLEEGGMHVTLA
ncbi:barstar family protein [Streptomyces sp. BE20]|uniref:barstar family protein n=1 Tax=Streptomyces sp. BE20 TaxID=3002525 RepID=UPI002E76135B|nr:barstar family protein [Streptomyces sp. BE20]MEE1823709.1 barstar family protein [Streptomyces sp. BE20]